LAFARATAPKSGRRSAARPAAFGATEVYIALQQNDFAKCKPGHFGADPPANPAVDFDIMQLCLLTVARAALRCARDLRLSRPVRDWVARALAAS